MSPPEFTAGPSRVVAGRYPAPGTDSLADAMRERRGARGLTPLDANLLHIPLIASGYNTMLGAIRTKGNLPGDIREAMILRVGTINHAAFEWIHHEHVGRKEGLSTGQLYAIRDAKAPLPPVGITFTSLQTAALAYADHSTRDVRVPTPVIQELKQQLKELVSTSHTSLGDEEINTKVDDLYVEATMVVAAYNLVSRFLLGTDVAGISDMEVPWPVDRREHYIALPSFPPASIPTHTLHVVTLITSPSAPWLVFSNSLLTDWSMWSLVIPYFLDLQSSENTTYNILLHSQRGHGLSTLPPKSEVHERRTTIPLLASDIANILGALSIPTPVHAVVGVSQGGAAALAFAAMFGDKTKGIVACDTAARTPAGNKEAWEERIRLVRGLEDPALSAEYAKDTGMGKLSKVTVPRWFPPGSLCSPGAEGEKRARWVEEMVMRTDVDGFVEGARALGDYDVLGLSPVGVASANTEPLFKTSAERILLLAGRLDGGGKVGKGLQNLSTKWNSEHTTFVEIANAGHLPMIDSPAKFCEALKQWLATF